MTEFSNKREAMVGTDVRSLRPDVPGLTGLRFAAAFSVAIAHGSEQILRFSAPTPDLMYWLPQLAGLGMGLFFVLSGFVIHYNYRIAVTQGGLNGLGGFVWARFSRLYPLYFLIVVLDVLLGRQLFEFMTGNVDPFTDVLHALPYYLTFTQSWIYHPFANTSLIYAIGTNSSLTWSISTEWFFYLSYPLVALLVMRIRRPFVVVFAALAWCVVWITVVTVLFDKSGAMNAWAIGRYGSVAAYATFVPSGDQNPYSFVRWLLYFSPYVRIGEFILGCFLAQLYVLLQDRPASAWERAIGRALLVLGIVSVPIVTYMMYAGHWPSIRKLNYNFGLAPSVALILFCAARYDTWFARCLNARPIVALGEASYSIYLTHFLIFNIAVSFLGGALSLTAANVTFLAIKYLFLLGLILLISLGLHAYVEVPARQWLRGLWRETALGRRRAVAYSVFASPALAAVLVVLITPADTAATVLNGVHILSATYGGNCRAPRGNATRALSRSCNGKNNCAYVVDVNLLGDPAPGCGKDFVVDYQCAPVDGQLSKTLPGEAGLKSRLDLSCPSALANADTAGSAGGATPGGTKMAEAAAPGPALALSAEDPTISKAQALSAAAAPTASQRKQQTAAVDSKSDGTIHVLSATYGGNCGAPPGNATSDAQMACDGEQKCTYTVDVNRLGDPTHACGKAFALEYQCTSDGTVVKAAIPAEAGLGGKSVELSCQSGAPRERPAAEWTGIRILSATYGKNCGARIGNVTEAVEKACGAEKSCDYTVDVNKLGDPVQGCDKSFFVKYQCGGGTSTRFAGLPSQPGYGRVIHLACP
jgi:peptidoglycan/LPS O-acetylase OafA/YrhL